MPVWYTSADFSRIWNSIVAQGEGFGEDAYSLVHLHLNCGSWVFKGGIEQKMQVLRIPVESPNIEKKY